MQDTNTQQATDQTVAQPTITSAPVMPTADVTMTPAPMATEPTVMDATAGTPGPAPVVTTPMPVEEVKTDVKVELPDVSAATTPVATEASVTATPTV